MTILGNLAPGNSAGHITIAGDLNLIEHAVFDVELGSLLRGTQYDAVDVSGNLRMDQAVLNVSSIGGFVGRSASESQATNCAISKGVCRGLA